MSFRKYLILAVVAILFGFSSVIADPFSYNIGFNGGGYPPIYEIEQDGYPGISFYIRFGGFDIKPCDHCYYCPPPPVVYYVRVLWQNPNDPGGDPECWIPAFGAYAFYGEYGTFHTEVFMGTGSITLLDPDPDWPQYYNTCCWSPLKCEGNTWKIKTWPVVSGVYKVELYKWIYDWTFCWWCYSCQKHKFCPWWGPEGHFAFVTSHTKKINNQSNDFTALTRLFYVSADNQDTLYDKSAMEVMKEYDIVCQIHTTKRIEDIPNQLIGYLEPEDVVPPTQKIFYRDPAGDIPLPCNQDYPLRIYGYRCIDGFRPYELFPGIDPPEWAHTTKYLDCKLYGENNQAYNDIEMRTYVMSYLQLDCTNDSTVCFRPTAGEKMEFEFRFGAELGLKPDDDIRFKITDKDDITVYEKALIIPFTPPFENPFGVPAFPSAHTMRLVWDGRVNAGPNIDHLADPALDSYSAIVEIYENGNPQPIMESNIETFDVVPTIDSVLVTHYPWYIPRNNGENIYIYSLARGKIDDSDNAAIDYRYYYPQGEQFPINLGFWDGDTFRYWDLLPNVCAATNYYRYLDNWLPYWSLTVDTWNSSYWGTLSYKWFVVLDFGERRKENGVSKQFIDYYDYDSTSSWGTNWRAIIQRNVDWRASGYFDIPFMRFGVRSQITNQKDGHTLNDKISAEKAASHRIILGADIDNPQQWINYFWAISHIGTPYRISTKIQPTLKKPYEKIDCSGLVVATRIQELDNMNNYWYRINDINVQHLVGGFYYYPCNEPPSQENKVYMEIEQIQSQEVNMGCPIALKPRYYNKYSHIVLNEWLDLDPEDLNRILHCYGIHARGDARAYLRRVRYDNLLRIYRQWRYGGIWEYKYLRFTEN